MSLLTKKKSNFGDENFVGTQVQSQNFLQVDEFIQYVTNMSSMYRTNNVIITMGEDFNYQSAHMWYKNLDKLIK